MIISSTAINDVGLGNPRVIVEANDNTPTVPAIIQTTVDALVKTLIASSGITQGSDQSVVVSTSANIAASNAATSTTLLTLTKGNYTIDLNMSARFVGTPTPSGTPDVSFDLVAVGSTQNAVMLALYAQTLTAPTVGRRFQVTLVESCLLRAKTAATGVGQTIEATWSTSVERHV